MSDIKFSQSFDKIADEYEKYRTGYPIKVIEDIFSIAGLIANDSYACEIGCGTGQATISFAEYGLSILSIEPREALVTRAKKNLSKYPKVSFLNTTFENAQLSQEAFDLVFAAQSFHWVDTSIGYEKIAKILKPKGFFSAFWKFERPIADQIHRELDRLYVNYLPSYTPVSEMEHETEVIAYFESLAKSKLFVGCQMRRYPLGIMDVDSETFCNEMSTWSKIAILEKNEKEDLLSQMRQIIDGNGGMIRGGVNEVILICGFRA